MLIESENKFSLSYLRQTLLAAKTAGYRFGTVHENLDRTADPSDPDFILRIDLDRQPLFLVKLLDVLAETSVKASIYVRTQANDYSPMSYQVYPLIKRALDEGHEIGLHTSCVEFARINKLDPKVVFAAELAMLRSFFPVTTVAPHRDVNFCYNSLPWLNENWAELKKSFLLTGHSYEERLMARFDYLNEGPNPHLKWRAAPPEIVIETRRPIYLLIHPHWWWSSHPFEF